MSFFKPIHDEPDINMDFPKHFKNYFNQINSIHPVDYDKYRRLHDKLFEWADCWDDLQVSAKRDYFATTYLMG